MEHCSGVGCSLSSFEVPLSVRHWSKALGSVSCMNEDLAMVHAHWELPSDLAVILIWTNAICKVDRA